MLFARFSILREEEWKVSMAESIQDLCVHKGYYDVEPFKTGLNSFEVKYDFSPL